MSFGAKCGSVMQLYCLLLYSGLNKGQLNDWKGLSRCFLVLFENINILNFNFGIEQFVAQQRHECRLINATIKLF